MKKYLIIILICLFPVAKLFSCTSFYCANGGRILFGNNEDWKSPFSKIWVIQGNENSYGKVYFGFHEGGYMGGINDQGLVFDGFATKYLEVTQSVDKEVYSGDLLDKAMSECSNVDEVIELFSLYNLQFMSSSKYIFGDRSGNSAIIEGDSIIRKSERYQISTNFYQSQVSLDSINCIRYLTATDILENNNTINIDIARRILADTHQEGKYPTQYSNIYDINEGKIYLYNYHNYENVVLLDIEIELKKGTHSYDISSLFDESYAYSVYKKSITDPMKMRLLEKEIVNVDTEILLDYCGKYEIDPSVFPGYFFYVTMDSGKLFIEASFQDKSEILAESFNRFILIGMEETYEFEFLRDPEEQSNSLVAHMFGMALKAKKVHY